MGRNGSDMQVETGPPRQPLLHLGVFVGVAVIDHGLVLWLQAPPALNHQGQVMVFKIIGGNTNDRQPLELMTDELRGNVSAIRDTFPSH